jgi:hypothetical protein
MRLTLDPRISHSETARTVYPALGQADEPIVGARHGSQSDARSCGVGVGKCVSTTAGDRVEPREGTPATYNQDRRWLVLLARLLPS